MLEIRSDRQATRGSTSAPDWAARGTPIKPWRTRVKHADLPRGCTLSSPLLVRVTGAGLPVHAPFATLLNRGTTARPWRTPPQARRRRATDQLLAGIHNDPNQANDSRRTALAGRPSALLLRSFGATSVPTTNAQVFSIVRNRGATGRTRRSRDLHDGSENPLHSGQFCREAILFLTLPHSAGSVV